MDEPVIRYDEPSDTLHVAFGPKQGGTGLELNENILLRVDKPRRLPVGLTIFNFSLLAQRTEMGPRSFPLSGIADLSPEMRELALDLLLRAPVAEFLNVSAYSPGETLGDVIPISSVLVDRMTAQAA